MEPLRLDPTDPFASVRAWLAALAQALGLDCSRLAVRIRLNRAAAAVVRRWLADWSRQLRIVVHGQAARLAVDLLGRRRPATTPPARPAGQAARRAVPPTVARAGSVIAVAAGARRHPPAHTAARLSTRRDPAEFIDDAEDGALRLRTRAVLAALRDPSAMARRLARRLALRLARARAADAARRGRLRFPHPPRALGTAPRAVALAPALRPPDGASACLRAARPTASVAAPMVLAAGVGWTRVGPSQYPEAQRKAGAPRGYR